METAKSNNERELTSTMGNVLSTSSKDEKNDTNDATPTSSTDASTTSTASQIVSDDPISSTSSDVVEQNKPKAVDVAMQNSVDVSQTASDEPDKSSSADHEADLLEMSISNVANEKITEDVEDLVHDLESLLGESTDSFNVPVKRKEDKSPEDKEAVCRPQTSVVKDQELQSSDAPEEKNSSIVESQQEVSEITEKTPQKEQGSEPEITKVTSLPESASHEASDSSSKAQDPFEETSEVKSSITDDVEEMSSETVDTEYGPEGIVSEPEQTNKRSEEIPASSEVEIVEIIESAELKSMEGQAEVEGIVSFTDKPVEDIPEIIVEPSEEIEPKVTTEEVAVEVESVEQPDEIEDKAAESEAVEVLDTASEEIVQEESALEVPSDETQGEAPTVPDSEEISSKSSQEVTEKVTEISELHTESESEAIDSVTPVNRSEGIEEEKLGVENELVEACETSETREDRPSRVEEVVLTADASNKDDEAASVPVDEAPDIIEETEQEIEQEELPVETPKEDVSSIEDAAPVVEDVKKSVEIEEDEDKRELAVETLKDVSSIEDVAPIMEEEVKAPVEVSCGDVEKSAEKPDKSEEIAVSIEEPCETVETTNENKFCEETLNVEPPCETVEETDETKFCEEIETDPSTVELSCKTVETAEKIESYGEKEGVTIKPPRETDEATDVIKPSDETQPLTVELTCRTVDATEEINSSEETQSLTVERPCETVEATDNIISSEEPQSSTVEPPCETVELVDEIKSPQETVELICETVEATDEIKSSEEPQSATVEPPCEIIEATEEVQSCEEIGPVTVEAPPETVEAAEEIKPCEQTESVTVESNDVAVASESSEVVATLNEEGESVVEDVETEIAVEKIPSIDEVQMVELPDEKGDKTTDIQKVEISEATNDGIIEEEPVIEGSFEEAQLETAPVVMDSEAICSEAAQKVTEEDPSEKSENQTEDRSNKTTDSLESEDKSDQIERENEEKLIVEKEASEPLEKVQDKCTVSSPAEEIATIEDVEIPELTVEASDIIEEISDSQMELPESTAIIEMTPTQDVSEETSIITETETLLVESSAVVEGPEEMPSVCVDINVSIEESSQTVDGVVEITSCEEASVDSQDVSDNLMPSDALKEVPHIENKASDLKEEEEGPGVEESESEESASEIVEDVEENSEAMTVPELSSDTEEECIEKEQDSKVIEISDDDSETSSSDQEIPKESSEDYVQVLSSSSESDSEEIVPVLALEPDESTPSPYVATGEKDNVAEVGEYKVPSVEEETLPEIEEILADQSQDDEAAAAIDMQENLETILAVASLQSTEVEPIVEPQISDTERREMEALRKAVESITENSPVALQEVDNVVDELIKDADLPVENDLLENHEDIVESVENKVEMIINNEEVATMEEVVDSVEKAELPESDNDQDVPELRIEDSAEEVEENLAEAKEHERSPESLPDTSETAETDTKEILPDSSQVVSVNEEAIEAEVPKETKIKSNERSRRHRKSVGDNKLEELIINVDVPDREKPYSPKVTIKPIKVPDDEVSTTSNSDSEMGKGSLKMTITKQSDKMHSILKICDPETSEAVQEPDEPIPKLIIKPKMQQVEQQHSPKMSTRSSKQMYSPTSSTQRSGSPRITIKPVVKPQEKPESVGTLKIKLKPDETSKKHNQKQVLKPEDESSPIQTTRRVIIKPVVKPVDEPEQGHSPRITIKPIPKPDGEKETVPRLSIKVKKQDEEELEERSSPKIIIKPIAKPPDLETTEVEEDEVKERIVLKINKGNLPTPTKESKKREHPPDEEKLAKITVKLSKCGHPHIVHQNEESNKRPHEEQAGGEKSKKQKTELESMSTRSKHKEVAEPLVETRSKHRDSVGDNQTGEVLKARPKELESQSHESTRSKHKDPLADSPVEAKKARLREAPSETTIYESARSRHSRERDLDDPDVSIIETKPDSPIVISEDSRSQDSGSCVIVEDVDALTTFEMRPEPAVMTPRQDTAGSAPSTPSTPSTPTPRKRGRPRKVPIVVREEFKEQEEPQLEEPPQEEEPRPVVESGRPKRSCRGQSVRATLGIKPRKPRGGGRGRGSKRGMGSRAVPMKPESEPRLSKARLKLMQESAKRELAKAKEEQEKAKRDHERQPVLQCLLSNIEIKAPVAPEPPDSPEVIEVPSSPVPEPEPEAESVPEPEVPVAVSPAPPSPKPGVSGDLSEGDCVIVEEPETAGAGTATVSAEIVMVDEETRMSADTNSRAQTPAKQVPADAVIEESQSSVQSTATTESGKARPNKAPRLEVQDTEGAIISADQLTEYYWNGNGPFMLQEQVAQFLGIKSFKRKYPGIARRALDMQERDFIKESGLASEHMCDLGLTAVNSADILDIMYADFQDKYEEYCKHQRDRQAKDLINKQKALSLLAASQDKNKADITEQAVQSAAQWNASFNKTRKEQRKACMDLQTLTVHYPKGKLKQISKAKVGNYPVALVPGQFTDYYTEFTPTEINNLPLNTLCYDPINIIPPDESDDSGSEGSDSDSDSCSSSSGSDSDSSSGIEDCKLCKHSPKKAAASK